MVPLHLLNAAHSPGTSVAVSTLYDTHLVWYGVLSRVHDANPKPQTL